MLLNRVLHNRFTCMLKYGHQTITFIWKNLTFYSSLFNFFFLKFRIIKFMKMSVNNPKDEYLISQHIVKIQQYISSRLWIKIRNLQGFFYLYCQVLYIFHSACSWALRDVHHTWQLLCRLKYTKFKLQSPLKKFQLRSIENIYKSKTLF